MKFSQYRFKYGGDQTCVRIQALKIGVQNIYLIDDLGGIEIISRCSIGAVNCFIIVNNVDNHRNIKDRLNISRGTSRTAIQLVHQTIDPDFKLLWGCLCATGPYLVLLGKKRIKSEAKTGKYNFLHKVVNI